MARGPVPGRRPVWRVPDGCLGHVEGLGPPLRVLALHQVVREPLPDPAAQLDAFLRSCRGGLA